MGAGVRVVAFFGALHIRIFGFRIGVDIGVAVSGRISVDIGVAVSGRIVTPPLSTPLGRGVDARLPEAHPNVDLLSVSEAGRALGLDDRPPREGGRDRQIHGLAIFRVGLDSKRARKASSFWHIVALRPELGPEPGHGDAQAIQVDL
jgi:hypothetical protein